MPKYLILIVFIIVLSACESESSPKPKAYLRLQYPAKEYKKLKENRPYTFEYLQSAIIVAQKNNWVKITYPKLKASVDITYFEVKDNLRELLIESEKLVYEHAVKADEIPLTNYENFEEKVFGTLYEITGDTASQLQFHATDSTRNFIKGTLYFYAKPNYDSILPAVDFIKKDMVKLMETLAWKTTTN